MCEFGALKGGGDKRDTSKQTPELTDLPSSMAKTKNRSMNKTANAHARWTDPTASFSQLLKSRFSIVFWLRPRRCSSTTDTSSRDATDVAADVASSTYLDFAIVFE